MDVSNIRDYAMYAAIFGMFAFAWFGWAQENPPDKLRPLLGIGSGVSLAVAAIGGFLGFKNWDAPSALNAEGAYAMFGVVVAAEILLCLAGSLWLLSRHKNAMVAPWVSLVVGLHFIPLAILFEDPWLYLLAGLMAVVVAVSFKSHDRWGLRVNTAACLSSGVVLLLFACRGLILYALS